MSDNDAVWAQVAKGGILQDLFGSQPTFEDARIREIVRTGDDLSITLDCRDRIASQKHEPLWLRVRLEFEKPRSAELNVYSNDVLAVSFREVDGRIVTEFVQCTGTWGKIVSEGLEVVLDQEEPPMEDELETETLRLRLA